MNKKEMPCPHVQPRFRRPTSLLIGVTILVLLPYALRGWPAGHDSHHQLAWADAFYRQLSFDEVYPRWLVDLGVDHGVPTFFFYPPAAFYLVSFLIPLVGGPAQALMVSVIISVACGLAGIYRWLHTRFDSTSSVSGALVFLLMPYHLVIDLAVRSAYSELWGLALMPWILISIDYTSKTFIRGLVATATLIALLLLTHPPTSVLFIPFALLYAIYICFEQKRWGTLISSLFAITLGAALSAVYLLPALTQGEYADQAHMFSGDHNHYSNWFLFNSSTTAIASRADYFYAIKWAFLGDSSYFKPLIDTITVGSVLFCWALFASRKRDVSNEPPRISRFALCTVAVSTAYLALNCRISAWLWAHLIVLPKVQFPWRTNGEITLCAAILAACAMSALLTRNSRVPARAVPIAVGTTLAIMIAANLAIAFKYAYFTRANEIIAIQSYRSAPEHRVPSIKNASTLFRTEHQAAFVSGHGEVTVTMWSPRHIKLTVKSDAGGILAIAQQYYPGWAILTDDSPRALSADLLSTEYGVVGVAVPPGRHSLNITLGWTPHEKTGWIISGIAFTLLCLLFAIGAIRRTRRQ